VRGYVSCVVECPYDGAVAPEKVAFVTEALLRAGCFEVSLGDTIGRGSPEQVSEMLARVLEVAEPGQLAGHFHDTSGRAVENVRVALEHGLRVFDAAVGGLGGCPYAPGAAGNVATETIAMALEEDGFAHGLDLAKLSEAATIALSMKGAG